MLSDFGPIDVDAEVSSGDEKRETAALAAAKTRKRAGLPELELDALPSVMANKMMCPGLA